MKAVFIVLGNDFGSVWAHVLRAGFVSGLHPIRSSVYFRGAVLTVEELGGRTCGHHGMSCLPELLAFPLPGQAGCSCREWGQLCWAGEWKGVESHGAPSHRLCLGVGSLGARNRSGAGLQCGHHSHLSAPQGLCPFIVASHSSELPACELQVGQAPWGPHIPGPCCL